MKSTLNALRNFNLKGLALSSAFTIALLASSNESKAQNILFINDNNYITYNTDTILSAMNHTIYSSYHYWSIPDSAFVSPSDSFMATFDLVVWYCSTDGVGLGLWNGSPTGNTVAVNYAASGKPMWIIGQDILYQEYGDSSHFAAGDFAYNYMGLSSYDGQSYVDDGATGLPEADRVSTASTLFPATLKWEFSTLWYADACTPNPGVKAIYEMGPSSYVMYGKDCMFHNHQGGVDVMSTFFDPALIDSFSNRVTFLQNGITYLLGTTSVKNTTQSPKVAIYPNPAKSMSHIQINTTKAGTVSTEVYSVDGKRMLQQTNQIASGNNNFETSLMDLSAGVYFISIKDSEGKAIYTDRLIKE